MSKPYRKAIFLLVDFYDFINRLSFYQELTYDVFQKEHQKGEFIIEDQDRFFSSLMIIENARLFLYDIWKKAPESIRTYGFMMGKIKFSKIIRKKLEEGIFLL
jgi:hypothetical protein